MSGSEIAEIINVINLYPIAVDSLRWDLFDDVFTPDIHADFGGPARWDGLDALKEAFAMIHAPFHATQHATQGHHVRIDGERASCLSYVHGRFIRAVGNDAPGSGDSLFASGGWYDDALVRTAAGWRISRRVCRSVWWEGNPKVMETAPGISFEAALDSLQVEVAAGRVGHLPVRNAAMR